MAEVPVLRLPHGTQRRYVRRQLMSAGSNKNIKNTVVSFTPHNVSQCDLLILIVILWFGSGNCFLGVVKSVFDLVSRSMHP